MKFSQPEKKREKDEDRKVKEKYVKMF